MTDRREQSPNLLHLPDGRSLGYAQYGERGGMPLLAVHGTPGSRLMLQAGDHEARSKGIWLIAPDRPGYGLSSPCEEFSPAQWVEDIKFLLTALGIEQFLLLGVSGGGPFAMTLATLLPERVRAVALVSPVGLFDQGGRLQWSARHKFIFSVLPRLPWLMKLAFPVVRFTLFYAQGLFVKIFARTLAPADRAILANPHHIAKLLDAFHEGLRNGIEGMLADLRFFSSPPELEFQQAAMPVLIWQGMADLMVPPSAALSLARALPNVETMILDEAGHFWIFDHVEEVLEQLAAASPDRQ